MKKVNEFHCNCFYMFESLASGRTCYFESEEEIEIFKLLFTRYMNNYVEVYHMEISSEGYQVLIKTRERRTVVNHYKKQCDKKGKSYRVDFIKEPWHIISEQMRIFLSLYARKANKLREREGVLVKKRFERFLFETEEELLGYLSTKNSIPEIQSQRNPKYRVELVLKKAVNWGMVRARNLAESIIKKAFHNLVVVNLIKSTLLAHSSSKTL